LTAASGKYTFAGGDVACQVRPPSVLRRIAEQRPDGHVAVPSAQASGPTKVTSATRKEVPVGDSGVATVERDVAVDGASDTLVDGADDVALGDGADVGALGDVDEPPGWVADEHPARSMVAATSAMRAFT
jgi:hypothetical protein